MHLGARGFVHAELIDPDTGDARRAGRRRDAASSCSPTCATGPRRCCASARATTSQVRTSPCPCGRTGPRVRCIGRTDDMLIVRGVNVFPSAVREVVERVRAARSAATSSSGRGAAGVKQEPPLPVERRARPRRDAPTPALADAIRDRLRSVLVVQTRVELVPWGSLQRSEYKSKLVERWRPSRCASSRARASTTSRSSAPTARRRSTSGRACSGMPFVFEQPNLDNASESHLYFDPGDGRLITVFTNEERDARPGAAPRPIPAASTTSRSRSRRRPSARRSSGSTSAASATAASRTAASWTRSTSTIRSAC